MKRIGLVLGGGGITGFAHITTTLSVLQQLTGWDPRSAEAIVGTSAGANVAGLLRGDVPVSEALDGLMRLPANPRSMARLRQLSGRESARSTRVLPVSLKMAAREVARGPSMRPGRLLSGLAPPGNVRTDSIGDRLIELHGDEWPDEDLYITTVRVEDGQRVVFGLDRTDVDVGTAVEASSAIPGFFQPVWIENNKYLDGGVHSPINADLLAGRDYDLIVVVAPMSIDDPTGGLRTLNGPVRLFWRNQIHNEVDEMREDGENVLLIEPTTAEAKAMGPTMMDPTRIVNVVMQTTSAARASMTESRVADQLAILRKAGSSGNGSD